MTLRRSLLVAVAAPCLLVAIARPALAQITAGPEFQVNSYTNYDQLHPVVAVGSDGNFVVIWESTFQDGSAYGIFGQRYDVSGTALGAEFRINSYTTGFQSRPSVAPDNRGNVVVVWGGRGDQDGSGQGVSGRRYDASGAPLGPEFLVNTYTTSYQRYPSVAVDGAGNFIVVWQAEGSQDGSFEGIFGQRFDASGTRRGAEFQVNTYTTSSQRAPRVASDPSGSFVVVWRSAQDGSGYGLFAQRFDAAGAPRGGEFQVNTYTTYSQRYPSVAADRNGNFIVVWTSRQDGSSYGIIGQRFDAAGAPLGDEFRVNTYTTGSQGYPAVAADAGGRFVVVWQSTQDGSSTGILAQRFQASGAPRGGEFRVNSFVAGTQRRGALASDAIGNLVVSWESALQDGTGYGIFAQRFGGLRPATLAADPALGGNSDGNSVLEPGEMATVQPGWRNVNGSQLFFGGSASSFTGPAGATYTIADGAAVYGLDDGQTGPCAECYRLGVSNPATRPAQHWDAAFSEELLPSLQLGQTKRWTLHVGASFSDVPRPSIFYRFIETLLHHGVTGGCGGTSYCPSGSTTREQMAPFVLVAREGAGYGPPACTTPLFNDVPASSPFCRWIEELARRGVVSGCGGGNYCPTQPVTREQMAVFVLRTLDPTLNPPACTTPVFNDVPASSLFCRWVEELARRGVVTGCGGGNYCPTQPVTREQMAVFLAVTFGLMLYGP